MADVGRLIPGIDLAGPGCPGMSANITLEVSVRAVFGDETGIYLRQRILAEPIAVLRLEKEKRVQRLPLSASEGPEGAAKVKADLVRRPAVVAVRPCS